LTVVIHFETFHTIDTIDTISIRQFICLTSNQNKLWKLAFKLCMISHQTRTLRIAAFHVVISQTLWEL